MPWPFSTPVVFTYDSGFVDVPTSHTELTSNTVYVMGMTFANTTVDPITIYVTDSAATDGVLVPTYEVPANGLFQPPSWNLMPTVGIKWSASAIGLKGKIWGW